MKAMKKFLALIVALVMAVSCLATAFAAGSVSVSASNKSAKPGDIIEIAVSVSEASFAGYSLKLNYDTSALKLVSITKNAANNPGLFSSNTNAASSKVGTVSMINDADFTASGTLFTATFAVLDTAADGTYTVTLANASFAAADQSKLSVSVSNGSVEVKTPHTHNYSKVVTEPTCTVDGYTAYTCSCGDSYTEDVVKAAGHKWDDGTVTTAPTESAAGVRTYKCSACGETKTEEIPALDHTHQYTSTGTAPTCTEDGYITYTCACGDSYQKPGKEAIGHIWEKETVTEPTCDKAGSTVYACGICGEKKTEETAALGHKWDNGTVTAAATCTEKGNTAYKCATCGETKNEEIAALGHKWGNGVVTTEPTENSSGVREYTCSDCSQTKTETIAALGHTHKYSSKVTAPTCTDKGYTTYTCDCGYSYKDDEVAAKGHKSGEPTFEWKADYSACTVSYSCSECDQDFTVNATVTVKDDSTCAAGGIITYTAAVTIDGKALSDVKTAEGKVVPHEYGATCTWGEGNTVVSVTLDCKKCDATKEVSGADVTVSEKKENGETVYTASFVVDGETYEISNTASASDKGLGGVVIGVAAAVVVIAAAAVVVVLKKKKAAA